MFTLRGCAMRAAAATALRSPAALRRAAPALASAAATRGIKLFDRLIPEDDPETKQRKAQEREILTKKMSRSVIGEMAAAQKEKARGGRQRLGGSLARAGAAVGMRRRRCRQ
jgi:hypothetical protein